MLQSIADARPGSALCQLHCRGSGRAASGIKLKWPNDLWADGRQARRHPDRDLHVEDAEVAIVAGFGVNLERPAADDLEDSATSLREEASDALPELPELIVHLCEHVSASLGRLGDLSEALEQYRSMSIHEEGEELACQLGDRLVTGTFVGFDDHGCLCLRTEGGEVTVAAGEVILQHPALS